MKKVNGQDIFIDQEIVEGKRLKSLQLRNLFEDYYNGSIEARNIIIERNIGVVYNRICSKYASYSYCLEDLLGIAMIALIRCVDTYNINNKQKFLSYLYRMIDVGIESYLRKENVNCEALETVFGFVDYQICDNFDYAIESASILELLKNCSSYEKSLIYMIYGLGERKYSYEEVAQIYGCSKFTIKIDIDRIIRGLREKAVYGYNMGLIKRSRSRVRYE